MTRSNPSPEPTPLQIQQARLVEEALLDAVRILAREGIPLACIDTGLKMAAIRFASEERGPPPKSTN